jgi:hypothetical protein
MDHIIVFTFIHSYITPGFVSAGIFPFHPDEFQLHDSVASFVSDRPIEEKEKALSSLVPTPSWVDLNKEATVLM